MFNKKESKAVKIGLLSYMELKEDFNISSEDNYVFLEELQDYLPPKIFKLLLKQLYIQDYFAVLSEDKSIVLSLNDLNESSFKFVKKIDIDDLEVYMYYKELFPKTKLLMSFCETHQNSEELYKYYVSEQMNGNDYTKEEFKYLLENGTWIYDLEQAEKILYEKVKSMTVKDSYNFFKYNSPATLEQFEELFNIDLELFVAYAVLDYYTHLDVSGKMFAAELDVDNIFGVVFDDELIEEILDNRKETNGQNLYTKEEEAYLKEFLSENELSYLSEFLFSSNDEELDVLNKDELIEKLEECLNKLKNKSEKYIDKAKEKVEDVKVVANESLEKMMKTKIPHISIQAHVDTEKSRMLEDLIKEAKEKANESIEKIKQTPITKVNINKIFTSKTDDTLMEKLAEAEKIIDEQLKQHKQLKEKSQEEVFKRLLSEQTHLEKKYNEFKDEWIKKLTGRND